MYLHTKYPTGLSCISPIIKDSVDSLCRDGMDAHPPFSVKIFIYTILSALPLVSGPLVLSLHAIENHRCPDCSCAGLFLEDQRRTRGRKLFMLLWWKLRPCVNTCINKSLCHIRRSRVHQLSFYWCHPTFSPENLKSAGLANACRTAKNWRK